MEFENKHQAEIHAEIRKQNAETDLGQQVSAIAEEVKPSIFMDLTGGAHEPCHPDFPFSSQHSVSREQWLYVSGEADWRGRQGLTKASVMSFSFWTPLKSSKPNFFFFFLRPK